MEFEIKLNNRSAIVNELKKDGDIYTIAVDGKVYVVDVTKIRNQEYSILHEGKSFNVEVIEKDEPKHYEVINGKSNFQIEVLDNESKYMQYRTQTSHLNGDAIIKSPMPGRVVKILVSTGDTVEAGQSIIILSAMKMESEFKTGKSGIVTEIAVKEGDTVDGNQILVVIEELV